MTKTENSRLRSALKGASYIIFHETLFFFIAWVIVGDAYKAVTITLIGSLAEFVLYYFHERVWSKIRVIKKEETK
jgi:uncharacterized membrane protein